MSTPTPEDLKARYPEFNEADDTQVGLLVSEAALEVDAHAWGKFYAAGVLALAAHMLFLENPKRRSKGVAMPGPMTGKKVGEIQFNYAAPPANTMDDVVLASTSYGQRYLHLRGLIAIGIRVIP